MWLMTALFWWIVGEKRIVALGRQSPPFAKGAKGRAPSSTYGSGVTEENPRAGAETGVPGETQENWPFATQGKQEWFPTKPKRARASAALGPEARV